MINYYNIGNILTHPLFLLIITVLLSGIFVPYFTRKYQSYQKELDLKINLLIKISESVFDVMNIIETYELKHYIDLSKVLSNRLEEWVKNANLIRTYIKAYFPGNSIKKEWDAYCKIIEMNSSCSIEKDVKNRSNKLKDLEMYIYEYEKEFIYKKNIVKNS